MEWLADPTAWLGLATLVVLEIVLGIDNLIFIAILADKLPPEERDRARLLGLSLALGMRLGLLAAISWIVALTDPLFSAFGHGVSGRDIILILGGVFLLFKATTELHERLEGDHHDSNKKKEYARFWAVVVQIVVLDAVFSLDSVITAVGMVRELSIMMIAVIIAMIVMVVASKLLMRFVSNHPTVVILCLGFLLMIGFSLVVEGVGFHLPKGYLYAAIGFAVLIEVFNQLARRGRRKLAMSISLRDRTADLVLRLMGGSGQTPATEEISALARPDQAGPKFVPEERMMIQSVLRLAERPVRTIMTPRTEVFSVDLSDDPEVIAAEVRQCPHARIVVTRDGSIDEPLGIVQKRDLLDALIEGRSFDLAAATREPLVLPETTTALTAIERFRGAPLHVAFVVDEYGVFQGLVTLSDLMQAITGELHEPDRAVPNHMQADGESWIVEGRAGVDELRTKLGRSVVPAGGFHTAAGLVLAALKRLPNAGDAVDIGEWRATVLAMDGPAIARLRFERHPEDADPGRSAPAPN